MSEICDSPLTCIIISFLLRVRLLKLKRLPMLTQVYAVAFSVHVLLCLEGLLNRAVKQEAVAGV